MLVHRRLHPVGVSVSPSDRAAGEAGCRGGPKKSVAWGEW